jgi:uncharacterized membrane protein
VFGDRIRPQGIVPNSSNRGAGREVKTSIVLFALVVPTAIVAVFRILSGQIDLMGASIVTLIISLIVGTLMTVFLRRRRRESESAGPGSGRG